MRRPLSALALLSLALAACEGAPEPVETTHSDLSWLQRLLSDFRVGPCASSGNNIDADGDGLDDGSERCVMETSAPAFNLYYSDEDDQEDHWPVNVDWY